MCDKKNKIENEDIKSIRENIDSLDEDIAYLLLKRLYLVKEIGKIKKNHNLKILDIKREKKKFQDLKHFTKDKGEESYLLNIYKKIMDESKSAENYYA